MNPIVA